MSNSSGSYSFSSPSPPSWLSSSSEEENLPILIEISSSSSSDDEEVPPVPANVQQSPLELAQNSVQDHERSFIITMKKSFMEGDCRLVMLG